VQLTTSARAQSAGKTGSIRLNGIKSESVPTTSTKSRACHQSETLRKLVSRAHQADRDSDRMRVITLHRPWKDKEKQWSPSRYLIAKFIHSRPYELLMTFIILINVTLTIWETDYKAKCYPEYFLRVHECPFNPDNLLWLRISNLFMLCLYTLEALGRLYVERSKYIRSKWNRLDAIVTFSGWISVLLGFLTSDAFIRIARCVRLLRAFRVLISRELYLLLNGIMSSLRAIFYGTILLFVMLVGYSVILVEWVHPHNSQVEYSTCVECTEGFRSVWFSVLTLFKELVAGDAWIMSFPLMEEHWWIAIMMMVIIMTVTLGVMNLILTIIVERATDAREADVQAKARHKASKQFETKKKLLAMCAEMDVDGSGMVSLAELLDAFDTSDEFRNFMILVGIQRDDLEETFRLLDTDSSGDLDYEEFCEELLQLESEDHRLSMAMLRYSVNDIRNVVENNVQTVLESIRDNLSEHQSHLQLLEDKLDDLLRKKCRVKEDNNSMQTLEHTQQTQPPEAEIIDIAVGFNDLHQEMQSLALLQADVVREVEGQVSALLFQAEQAASVGEALCLDEKTDRCNGTVGDFKKVLSDQQCSELQSLVAEIQRNLRKTMSNIIHEMQQKVSIAADTLDSSGNLMFSIQELVSETLDKPKPPDPLSFTVGFNSAPISRM